MKGTLFYKNLRRLKLFRSNEFQLEPVKIEPEKRNSVFGKISLLQKRGVEAQLKNRLKFLEEWKSIEENAGKNVLFTGPYGSGQVVSAGFLGKFLEKEVYRINLSRVTSKYIGETEKNLSKVFARAAGKEWILFFDEADALFGKRTNVRNSHDKYANQEVSYLLQKVDEHSGPVIISIGNKDINNEILGRFRLRLRFPLQENDEEEV